MSLTRRIADRVAAATTRRAVARRLAELDLTPDHTLRDEIDEWVAAHGTRLALLADDGRERLTYADLAGRAHRWARWAILHDVGRGERLALVMADRPERVAAWIGLCEAGAVAALVDPALPPEGLAAAIAAAGAAHIVVDAPLLARFEAAAPHLAAMAAVWVLGPHPMAYMRLDEALDDLSAERLRPADRRPLAPSDDALWLPTPEGPVRRIDHRGALRAIHAAAAAAGAGADDRLLLQGLGLADPAAPLAVGLALAAGATAVLVPTDSAEVVAEAAARHRATLHARAAGSAPVGSAALRLDVVIGREPAANPAGAPLRRTLVWHDGAIDGPGGAVLWRADAAPPRNASFAKHR